MAVEDSDDSADCDAAQSEPSEAPRDDDDQPRGRGFNIGGNINEDQMKSISENRQDVIRQ